MESTPSENVQATHNCSGQCTCAHPHAVSPPAHTQKHVADDDTVEIDTKGILKILAIVIVAAALAITVYTFMQTPILVGASGDTDEGPSRILDGPPEGALQKVTITTDPRTGRYMPYPIRLKVGVPVELTTSTSVGGCASTWYAQSLGIQGTSQRGKNVIYFVPQRKGTYPFACSMNMWKGSIIVE